MAQQYRKNISTAWLTLTQSKTSIKSRLSLVHGYIYNLNMQSARDADIYPLEWAFPGHSLAVGGLWERNVLYQYVLFRFTSGLSGFMVSRVTVNGVILGSNGCWPAALCSAVARGRLRLSDTSNQCVHISRYLLVYQSCRFTGRWAHLRRINANRKLWWQAKPWVDVDQLQIDGACFSLPIPAKLSVVHDLFAGGATCHQTIAPTPNGKAQWRLQASFW